MQDTQRYDLAVVGGGFAGLVAANRARQLGRSVVVLEQGEDELYACNSRFAGGVLHISYRNLRETPAELAQAMREITGGSADDALVDALSVAAPRAVAWLREEGVEIDGSGPVGWRQHLLAPARPPVTNLVWKELGADMTLRLLERNLARRGGTLLRGARARRLAMSDGVCSGVEIERKGAAQTIQALAVLLADGGFQANPDLVGRHISSAPRALKQRCAPSSVGDGLRMAQEAGAGTVGLETFYGHLITRDAMQNDNLWPYPQLDELAATGVLVDAGGRRFADEGQGGVFLSNAVAKLADPLGAVAVFDETIWQGAGRAAAVPPNPVLVEAGGTVHSAPTLAELAAKAGLPRETLERTVRDYNEALAAGRTGELQPARTARRHKPVAIAKPPYYAAPVCCGITFTTGGICIDRGGRVLRPDRSAIAGLYAAGSCTGGLDGGPLRGYIGGLMKAIAFGLLAVEDAAARST